MIDIILSSDLYSFAALQKLNHGKMSLLSGKKKSTNELLPSESSTPQKIAAENLANLRKRIK